MLQIIKTEWLKIKKYPAFWWVMAITALTYPGVNFMFIYIYKDITQKENTAGKAMKALLGNPFAFPEAWHTVAYFSSLFIFIPAIVIIMLITNEYTYKTNRQNIIDGWSRKNFMTGKMIDVLLLSVIVTALFTIVAFVIGITNTKQVTGNIASMSYYIGLFALQTFSQLSLAFMTGLLIRKSFISLAVFAFYFIILEPISSKLIQHKLHSPVYKYLPLEISNRLIPMPEFFSKIDKAGYEASVNAIQYHIWYTLLLIILTWVFCFWLFKKRDL